MSSKKRLDVAFPIEVYEKIKAIAIETNQPRHHKSGEVTLTPVVLNLINLGLERLAEEGLACLADLSDKKSDKTSDNTLKSDDLNQKIKEYIKEYIDERLEGVSNSLEYSIELNLRPILERIAALEERLQAPAPAPEPISPLAIALAEQATKAAERAMAEEVPSPAPEVKAEPTLFPIESIAPAPEGEPLAVGEDAPSPPTPMTQAELARRLGKKSDYLSRNRDKKDFSDSDPENIGWRFDSQKKLYFPLKSV